MKLKKNYIVFKVIKYDDKTIIKSFNNNQISVSIYYFKKDICYKTSINDYQKIIKLFPYYEITVVKYDGLIYYYYLIKKYYLAIIELIISIIIIYFLSFVIVDIDIETSDIKLKNTVNNALNESNIKPFTIRKSYKEIQDIKNRIKDDYKDEIDWIEITKKGMRYIINVEKRVKNNITNSPNYCNIYAKKDGMIKRVKTYNGISQVALNDYVSKDTLLISGDIKVNERTVKQVCASGVVYAEVWYIVKIKIPLDYYVTKSTNKIRNNIIIEYLDKEYPLFKNRLNKFESTKSLIWEILGVKIYKRKDYEIERTNKRYTIQEAVQKAQEMAQEKIKNKLEKDEKIINQKVLQKQLIDSTMNVDIFIITEEKIGYSNIEGW